MSTLNTSTKTELRHRILVVDDNESIRDDFRSILENLEPTNVDNALGKLEAAILKPTTKPENQNGPPLPNYELGFASQGKEGLEKVRRALAEGKPYALAFVDMRMPPGWDGLETIERIWAEDPELQVVICTAFSDYSWSDMYAKFGATQNLLILKKPFDTDEVRQMAGALTQKWWDHKQLMSRIEEFHDMTKEKQSEIQADQDKDPANHSDSNTHDPEKKQGSDDVASPTEQPQVAKRRSCTAQLDLLIHEPANPKADGRQMQVTTVDISTSGLAIVSKTYIHPGSHISFCPPGAKTKVLIHGEVMYCNYASEVGYSVGVKFLKYQS